MGKSGRHREAEEGGVEKKMVHLPNELIIQILMRLPVKSLLRFRCVSKSWFSLISDPHFATSHFELAAASTFRILYLPTSVFTSQTRSIDLDAASLDTDSASATLNLSFLPPTSYSKIMGSCRGFLLLSHGSHLYLWNPSTGIHKQLPLSRFMSRNANFLFFTFLYGFGYDPSTDDYLVLLASYDLASDLETYFELFSLKANAWKRIEGTHLSYMNAFDDPRAGTLLNGVIHWLAFRYDVSVDVIVAFDLMERSFSEVPLPDDFNQDFNFCDLCVLGGFLTLCVRGDDTIDIWVMREYKVQSSWTKSIVVSYSDLLPTLYFSPICFTESGDIVGMDGSTRLVKFNAKGQLLQHRSYCDDPHGCEAAMYTESILSLPYDSGQPAADD